MQAAEIFLISEPPESRAYRFLSQSFPGVQVAIETPPADWDYRDGGPLILVKSGGGPGVENTQILSVRISFEVIAASAAEANSLAYAVHGAIRGWGQQQDRVYCTSLGVPQWFPDFDTRAPAYFFTGSFLFKLTKNTLFSHI